MTVKSESNRSINKSRFLIVILPNLLFFIDLIIIIILVITFRLPWFLLLGNNSPGFWRVIELIIGYVFTVLGTMLLTWGTLSIGVSRAEGSEIGKPSDKSKLITSGAYSYCRHPITLGFLLAIPGISFIFDSITLMLLTIVYIPQMLLLLIYEERELVRRFGQDYIRYKELVPFLIPHKKEH